MDDPVFVSLGPCIRQSWTLYSSILDPVFVSLGRPCIRQSWILYSSVLDGSVFVSLASCIRQSWITYNIRCGFEDDLVLYSERTTGSYSGLGKVPL